MELEVTPASKGLNVLEILLGGSGVKVLDDVHVGATDGGTGLFWEAFAGSCTDVCISVMVTIMREQDKGHLSITWPCGDSTL